MTKPDGDGGVFDLEGRTAVFGKAIVTFCKRARADEVDVILVRQLVRLGTGVGANDSSF